MDNKKSNFLIFTLYGAMASWGDIAVGGHRPTRNRPSKSSILGLIAASLGINREQESEHKQLVESLGFSVCVRAPGEYLTDYHTAQVPSGNLHYASRRNELYGTSKKIQTVLSRRDYIADALYQIGIWEKKAPLFPLKKIQEKLEKPHFVLYLGRKSCPPSLPLEPEIISSTSLKDAFQKKINSSKEKMKPVKYLLHKKNNLISYYWENDESIDAGMNPGKVETFRDLIYSRSHWQFHDREEYCFSEEQSEI